MQLSSEATPVPRRWAQNLYPFLASLILVGILAEGLLIGPSLFAGPTWGRAIHGDLGALLLLLTLLLPLAGLLARLPRRLTLSSAALFGLTLIQGMSGGLGTKAPFLAALHPANAMLMFGLNVFLIIQGWQTLRQQRVEMKPA